MSDLLIELSQKALSLSLDERAQLAEELLRSLHGAIDPDVDAAWDQEIRRRVAEVESGAAKLIPAADVFAQVRRTLGR
jgi:putative addiction module component (TIGR02574 family)